MLRPLLVLLSLFTIFYLNGCDKPKPDSTPPILTIDSPENHAVYNNGDSLHVRITIEDNVKVTYIAFRLVETTYGNEHLKQSKTYDVKAIKQSIQFDQLLQLDLIDSVSGDTMNPKERNYEVQISAHDAMKNASSKTVKYHVLL